ncbi:hypothetical protein JRO89_XS04G0183900 [Xanthoceras sorbifolium]|uniref:Major facilitator superfamily (MFS) profile domain-containing protein n=1 Tax=Xanthoceras sorbifolium TaxID=99658 RepID=A0ABQ8I685_9ROSI|nr:hypothetical protein JRO89_XS04G0183900 [Xanthoceras sorbifolium]
MEEGLGESLLIDEAKPLIRNGRSSSTTDYYCEDMSGRGCQSKPYTTTAVVVLSTLVAVCGSFCYGCASGYSSPAESGIREDLGLSVAAYSVFGSIMTVGGMIGAILSGKLADIFGRRSVILLNFSFKEYRSRFVINLVIVIFKNKKISSQLTSCVDVKNQAMGLSEIFCTMGWLAIAFTKDSLWLDLGRLSIGFGVGIVSYVVPVYIAEIAPKDLRGVFTSTNQLMSTCGFSLVYLIGNVISWRSLALLGVIPCLLQLIGLFFIPESPRWLAKIGREKEFENALQRLRGKNADCSEEAADIRDHLETSQQHSEAGILDLFQRKYANSLIIGVGLMLLQQFGGVSALAYYASTIFEEADVSSSIGTTAVAIIQIPAVVLGVLLMDKAGRRPLLLISASGLCFFYILIGSAYCLQAAHHLKELTPIVVLIGFLGASVANSIGMSGIPWVIMSEIFPLNVKASAGSLVTLVNWSCSWIVTYFFNFIMEWSSAGDSLSISLFLTNMSPFGVYAATVLFIAKMVPETKGQTLEEIQASISTGLITLDSDGSAEPSSTAEQFSATSSMLCAVTNWKEFQ